MMTLDMKIRVLPRRLRSVSLDLLPTALLSMPEIHLFLDEFHRANLISLWNSYGTPAIAKPCADLK